MLTDNEAVELDGLEEKCLDSYGKPRIDGVDTTDLVRLAELQEKENQPDTSETDEKDEVVLESLTAKQLKIIAEKEGIKGFRNMNKKMLLKALGDYEAPEIETVRADTPEGFKYLGTNGKASFYTNKDGRAYMTNAHGKIGCVGNKFGDELLASLTK